MQRRQTIPLTPPKWLTNPRAPIRLFPLRSVAGKVENRCLCQPAPGPARARAVFVKMGCCVKHGWQQKLLKLSHNAVTYIFLFNHD